MARWSRLTAERLDGKATAYDVALTRAMWCGFEHTRNDIDACAAIPDTFITKEAERLLTGPDSEIVQAGCRCRKALLGFYWHEPTHTWTPRCRVCNVIAEPTTNNPP